MLRRLVPLLVFAAACAGPQTPPGWEDDEDFMLDGEQREQHREANRAALTMLMAQAQERAEAEPPDEDRPPEDLDVVVLEPPSTTLNPDGSLRSDAVDAFYEAGPHGVLGALEFEVVHLDGRPLGYRINAFHPHGAWIDEAGFDEGDVVTHINGHTLVVPEQFVEAWEGVPDAERIDVRIWREGRTVELAWPVRDPAP